MRRECESCGVDTITPIVNGCTITHGKHKDWCLMLAVARLADSIDKKPWRKAAEDLREVCEKYANRERVAAPESKPYFKNGIEITSPPISEAESAHAQELKAESNPAPTWREKVHAMEKEAEVPYLNAIKLEDVIQVHHDQEEGYKQFWVVLKVEGKMFVLYRFSKRELADDQREYIIKAASVLL